MKTIQHKKCLYKGVVTILSFILLSCSLFEDPKPTITNGFNLAIGEDVILTKNEIDAYDISSHYIYLKSDVRINKEELAGKPFYVICDYDTVYSGYAFISWDSLNTNEKTTLSFDVRSNQILCINRLNNFVELYSGINDPRSDAKVVQALKNDGIYHEGLNCSIDTVIRQSESTIEVNLLLENKDTKNYYYFDPNKISFAEYITITGSNFLLYDKNILHSISKFYETDYQMKVDCSVLSNYVSLIKGGETKKMKITYEQFPVVKDGEYIAVTSFCGSYFCACCDDFLEEGTIWRGQLPIVQRVTIK